MGGGTMLKSGVSKAKSGVTSAASKSSKGITAAKSKIKEKRDERRAKKQMKGPQGDDGDAVVEEETNTADHDDGDAVSHKNTKAVGRLSFNKRSEYVAKPVDAVQTQEPEEKGIESNPSDVAEDVGTDQAVEDEVNEQDMVEEQEAEQKEEDIADADTSPQVVHSDAADVPDENVDSAQTDT